MAVHSIIMRLSSKGIASTAAVGGKWHHTMEYTRARYGTPNNETKNRSTFEQGEERILKMSHEDQALLAQLLSMHTNPKE